MKGFSTNIVNLISDNLRDRYQSSFQIIKELLQNADDAKNPTAKQFKFGKHTGFPESKHQLLKGPALYFYNDGGFSKSDQRAIRSFAENSKAADENVIGKFGLGMKSIFHLCEAFFYVAHDGVIAYREGLNPWKQDEFDLHPDWDEISTEDWQRIKSIFDQLRRNEQTPGFMLWVPLRKKAHLITPDQRKTGCITKRFPGNNPTPDLDFLKNPKTPARLAAILPLLQNLEVISYCPLTPGTNGDGFDIRIKSDNRIDHGGPVSSSLGRVTVMPAKSSLVYAAFQKNSDDPKFTNLKNHSKWPKIFCRNELGHIVEVAYRARPEVSMMLGHSSGKGSLTIQWGVFLPLEEKSHIFGTQIDGGKNDYAITLHGQFFMDAGRRGLHGFEHLHTLDKMAEADLSESELRVQWNASLACEVTLPLFLPTLESYVKEGKLSDQECRDLTAAIKKANSSAGGRGFYELFQSHICAEYAWIREISPDGKHSWCLVRQDSKLRPLKPPPQARPELPWQVIPKLNKFSSPYRFLDSDAPSMVDHRPAWTLEEFIHLLEFDGGSIRSVFSDRSMLDYLYGFIAESEFSFEPDFQSQLVRLLRFGFRMCEEKAFYENRTRIERLVSLVSGRRRLKISSLKSLPLHVFRDLWQAEVDTLLVPSEIEPAKNDSSAKPDRNTVLLWLKIIHNWIKQPETKSRVSGKLSALDLAQLMLKVLPEIIRKDLLSENPELYVIVARDARTKHDVAVSFRMLDQLSAAGLIFGYAQGVTDEDRMGFATLIANVLPGERILLVKADLYRLFFEDSVKLPRAGNKMACLRALGIKARQLGNIDDREKVLEKVNEPGTDDIARRGLRYLLHGSFENFSKDQTPLWIPGHQQSAAWEKLWRLITGIGVEGAWNVLDRRLAGCLPYNQWDAVGIREINPSQVIGELQSTQNLSLDPTQFTGDECEEILSNVDDNDLWCRLPLHLTVEGHYVPVERDTFLEKGETIDPSLNELIHIIKKSENPQLSARQEKWILPLDAKAVFRIAIEAPRPSLYWRTIMDAAINIDKLPKELLRKSRETPWLLIFEGSPVKPEDVIDLPAIADEIDRLLAEHPKCFYFSRQLTAEIQNHPSFDWLRENCLASGDRGFERLALLLEETAPYHVGEIRNIDDRDFRELLPLLSEIVELPGWALLHRIAGSIDTWENCHSILLPALSGAIPFSMTLSVLEQIPRVSSDMNQVEKVFNLYLRLFARDKDLARTNLRKLSLLNCSKAWKPAEELCTGVRGIDPVSVLDLDQSSILEGIAVNSGIWEKRKGQDDFIAEFDIHSQTAASIAEDYFRSWQGLVPSGLIGAVVGLLGGDPVMRKLADSYLRPHSFDWLLNQLDWQIPRGWLEGLSAHQAINKFRFAIKTADPSGILVDSLTGDKIRVGLSATPKTLIVGEIGGRGYKATLTLRRMDTGQVSGGELSNLLRKTAETLLYYLYNQKKADLEGLWEELDRSDQLETEVACGLILEHIPFYLRQLKVTKRHPMLAQAILRYEICHQRRVESEQDGAHNARSTSELRLRVREARNDIAQLLQENAEVQKVVLDAVREKLRDYQYGPGSIVFELFQNADDAIVEQGLIDAFPAEGVDIPDEARRFVVECTDSLLRCMHWGRPINSRGPTGFDGESRGYHHDLENMLILSSSDKPAEGKITGKFGMGFKSVLLLCDGPRIISGRLQVEVIAGMLPKPWTVASPSREQLRKENNDPRRPGTLIELENSAGGDILSSFRELAGVLCVFAQAIRTTEVRDNGKRHKYVWEPRCVCNNVQIGRLNLTSSVWGQDTMALRIGEPGDSAGMLLSLGPSGFRPLPQMVPTIWVTAPSREQLDTGFAVNGSFDLDVGRAQLARGAVRNKQAAAKVGAMLGQSLCALFNKSREDWNEFREMMMVSKNLTPYAFWDTLWGLLGDGLKNRVGASGDEAIGLIVEMLWCNSSIGMRRLVTEKEALPTGLWGSHRILTRKQAVQYSCRGLLDQEDVFLKMTEWKTLGSEIPAGTLASHSRVGQALQKLAHDIRLTPLTLIEVLRKEFGTDGRIEPIMAPCYGKLINEKWLTEWGSRGGALRQEIKELTEFLTTLKFKGADGTFHPSNDLIVGHGSLQKSEDESLRAKFAPPNRILSEAYATEGVLFFLACRKAFEAGAETLAEWIRRLQDDEKRSHGLTYILKGELGRQTAIKLRPLIADTWLETLHGSAILQRFDHNQQMVLLGLLGLHKYPEEEEPDSDRVLNSKDVLSAIYDWWLKDKDSLIAIYNDQIYPSGVAIVPEEDGLRRSVESRKKWLKLFLLGALQSIGRTKLQQHREFILKCEREGWLDVFSDPEQRSEEWMQVLEKYLEDETEDVKFYQWMKQFVSIFQLSRWLPEYAEVFLAINHIPNRFDLTSVLKPRTNPAFQGGGPDAPPITRTLGIGAHFVIRELVRNGIVNNANAGRHCFMPTQMIRGLFEELGCDGIGIHQHNRWGTSEVIFEFVRRSIGAERATFCNCFDIPFRFICTEPELQIKFFHYELPEENNIHDEEE